MKSDTACRLIIQKLPPISNLMSKPTDKPEQKETENEPEEKGFTSPANSKDPMMNLNPEKVWDFDFRVNPERYQLNKNHSNFYRIFINFHQKKVPVVFAFQGTKEGKSLGVFVGKLENNTIKEVVYYEDFCPGEFIDMQFFKGKFYVLDSGMNLKVADVPLVAN